MHSGRDGESEDSSHGGRQSILKKRFDSHLCKKNGVLFSKQAGGGLKKNIFKNICKNKV